MQRCKYVHRPAVDQSAEGDVGTQEITCHPLQIFAARHDCPIARRALDTAQNLAPDTVFQRQNVHESSGTPTGGVGLSMRGYSPRAKRMGGGFSDQYLHIELRGKCSAFEACATARLWWQKLGLDQNVRDSHPMSHASCCLANAGNLHKAVRLLYFQEALSEAKASGAAVGQSGTALCLVNLKEQGFAYTLSKAVASQKGWLHGRLHTCTRETTTRRVSGGWWWMCMHVPPVASFVA